MNKIKKQDKGNNNLNLSYHKKQSQNSYKIKINNFTTYQNINNINYNNNQIK